MLSPQRMELLPILTPGYSAVNSLEFGCQEVGIRQNENGRRKQPCGALHTAEGQKPGFFNDWRASPSMLPACITDLFLASLGYLKGAPTGRHRADDSLDRKRCSWPVSNHEPAPEC